jgi:hypothetical protein
VYFVKNETVSLLAFFVRKCDFLNLWVHGILNFLILAYFGFGIVAGELGSGSMV